MSHCNKCSNCFSLCTTCKENTTKLMNNFDTNPIQFIPNKSTEISDNIPSTLFTWQPTTQNTEQTQFNLFSPKSTDIPANLPSSLFTWKDIPKNIEHTQLNPFSPKSNDNNVWRSTKKYSEQQQFNIFSPRPITPKSNIQSSTTENTNNEKNIWRSNITSSNN